MDNIIKDMIIPYPVPDATEKYIAVLLGFIMSLFTTSLIVSLM